MSFSPDGTRLASASANGIVKLWDVATGQELLTLKGHTSYVNSVVFSPDGTRLASAGDADPPQGRRRQALGSSVKVWDVVTGQETLTFKAHAGRIRSICFSPDGTRLASAGDADQPQGRRRQDLGIIGESVGRRHRPGIAQGQSERDHTTLRVSRVFQPGRQAAGPRRTGLTRRPR